MIEISSGLRLYNALVLLQSMILNVYIENTYFLATILQNVCHNLFFSFRYIYAISFIAIHDPNNVCLEPKIKILSHLKAKILNIYIFDGHLRK